VHNNDAIQDCLHSNTKSTTEAKSKQFNASNEGTQHITLQLECIGIKSNHEQQLWTDRRLTTAKKTADTSASTHKLNVQKTAGVNLAQTLTSTTRAVKARRHRHRQQDATTVECSGE